MQISYDMLPPPAADSSSRNSRRSSALLRKPDSLIIHKARAERRQAASKHGADSRPESADGPGKRNGRNSIIQPAVDPETGDPCFESSTDANAAVGDASTKRNATGGVDEEFDGEFLEIGGGGSRRSGTVAAAASAVQSAAAGAPEPESASRAKKKRVTFAGTVAAVHTLPDIPDFDLAARRGLFYSVYDIMQVCCAWLPCD